MGSLDKIIYYLLILVFALFSILKNNSIGYVVLAVVILLLFFVGVIRNGSVVLLSKNSFFKFLFVFVLICLLSNLWTLDSELTWNASFSLLRTWVFLNILYISMINQKTCNLFRIIMWGGALFIVYIISTIGIVEIVILTRTETRFGGEVVNANMFGMTGAVVSVICYSSILYKGISKDIIAGLLGIIVVFITGSRKALVMLIFGLFMVFLFKRKIYNYFSFTIKIICGISVAAALLYFLFTLPVFSLYAQRFSELLALLNDSGELTHADWERKVMIEVGWEQFLATPFTGIGLDCGRILSEAATGYFYYLHNNYIELLADVGIFGFISYYFIYFYFAKKIIPLHKYWTTETRLSVVLMSMYLLADWGYVSYYHKEVLFVIMICYKTMADTQAIAKSQLSYNNM